MSELSITSAAARAPGRIGLVWRGRAYCFAELAALAGSRELEPTQGFAVLTAERDLDTALAIYAALERRVPLILMHPRATAGERAAMLDQCRRLAPDRDLAAVLFTSGSSARPKAVLLDRRAFLAAAAANAAHLGWRDDDRWLCSLPLAHIAGLSILTRCLIARRCVVLDHRPAFAPVHVARLIARRRVTLLSLVPTMLERLLGADWTAPAHVRAVLLGGAAVPSALVSRARDRRAPVLVTYGMTETCAQVCTRDPGDTSAEPGRIGPPLFGVELRVVGERIQVRGPMLFRGYIAGAAVDPARDKDGWFTTGDRGRLDAAGVLHVLGRADDVIITGGENVDPAEVEAVLCAHPAVRAACVFAAPDPTWGQLVAAALVCDGSVSESLSDMLSDFVAARLARHKRPRLVCRLAALPTGPTGKVDRRAAAAEAAPRMRPVVYRRGE